MSRRRLTRRWRRGSKPCPACRSPTCGRPGPRVQQHGEPRRALHEGADGRAAQPQDQIPLPVTGDRPIGRLRRTLADHDLGGDEGLAPSACARPWHTQRPSGSQAGGQLAAQRPAALNVQRLVNGLVTDAHRLVTGEVEPQPACDLFRAPRRGPPSALPAPGPAALPADGRSRDRRPVRRTDHTSKPILHIIPQRRIDRQLCWLGPTGGAVGVPLRGRGPILQPAPAGGGVAAQLAGDRGRRALQSAGDLADAVALRAQKSDLLALRERKIAPGKRPRRCDRWDGGMPPALPEPAGPDRRRHSGPDRGVLARASRRDRRPEQPATFTPRHWRPTRRPQRVSPGSTRTPLSSSHRNLPCRAVATTN